MQTVEICVEEQYIDTVLDTLKRLKKGIIKGVVVKEPESYEAWNNKELEAIGKIGFVSKSFVEDDEDYNQW